MCLCCGSKPLFSFLCVCPAQNLHKQLEEAIQDGEIWVMQLKDTEYELEGSRERVQQQATEILHKASKMCILSSSILHADAAIVYLYRVCLAIVL